VWGGAGAALRARSSSVRISGSHPDEPGPIPGRGTFTTLLTYSPDLHAHLPSPAPLLLHLRPPKKTKMPLSAPSKLRGAMVK
jgi:hypothetical protein